MIYQIVLVFLSLFMAEDISAPILLSTVQQTGEYVTSDKQGNLYIINRNKISRYNLAGRNSGDYTWGYNITSVDASDPSRILLFSQNDRVVKYLDGTMNQYTVDIKLDELGFDSPKAACSDNVDGFWIYDAQQDQVFQVSSNLRINTTSYSVSAISKSSFVPTQMRFKNKQLFLVDTFRGVIILSNSANYITTLPLFGITNFDVSSKNEISYYLDDNIVLYNILNNERREIKLNVGSYISANCSLESEPPIIFIMNKTAVRAYGF